MRDTRRQLPNCNTRFVSQAEIRCAHLLAISIGNSYSCHRRIPTNAPFILMRNFKQHCGARNLSNSSPFFTVNILVNSMILIFTVTPHFFYSRKTSSLRYTWLVVMILLKIHRNTSTTISLFAGIQVLSIISVRSVSNTCSIGRIGGKKNTKI